MKKLTIIIIVTLAALITVVDVALLAKGYEWTISATLYEMSLSKPIFPFIFGILSGHLFWPNKRASDVLNNLNK